MSRHLSDAKSTIYAGLNWQVVLRAEAAWGGVLKLEHHRAPPENIAEFCFREHVVALMLDPAHALEWGIVGGHSRSLAGPDGNLGLFAIGTRIWWRRHQELEELVAALDPAFVAALTDRSPRRSRIGFHSLAGFQDPAVEYILLALHTEMRKGCPAGRITANRWRRRWPCTCCGTTRHCRPVTGPATAACRRSGCGACSTTSKTISTRISA